MRRISILDIMIVVSAVAVGSVILRECRPGLSLSIPGVVVGVWVVAWLRPRRGRPELSERIAQVVTWILLAQIGLLIGYGLIFG